MAGFFNTKHLKSDLINLKNKTKFCSAVSHRDEKDAFHRNLVQMIQHNR